MREQAGFEFESTGIAGQGTVLADDTMAWDDDRHRVLMVRRPDGPRRPWPSEATRNLPVRRGLPVGNLEKDIPDGSLKRCAVEVEPKMKLPTRTSEVLTELMNRGAVGPGVPHHAGRFLATEPDLAKTRP
jgi:hypothetical protein